MFSVVTMAISVLRLATGASGMASVLDWWKATLKRQSSGLQV